MAASFRIGISGWRYPPWRKLFYPPDLKQALELHFASRALPSIELNGSFYALQTPERYANWYADTPEGFVFSIKASQLITHIHRLVDIEAPLADFFASGLFMLKEKLGPILWQFPPSFRFDAERFEAFLKLLPHDTEAAQALARQHGAWMKPRACVEIDKKRPLRHAVEIRHPSFACAEFAAMLRRYKVALVIADTAGKWPEFEDVTADFIYMRLHGADALYASGYSDAVLANWAEKISAWASGGQPEHTTLMLDKPPLKRATRDVYCYFDNTMKVQAPFNARRLLHMLGQDEGLTPMPDFDGATQRAQESANQKKPRKLAARKKVD
ncbi:hypothetical protein IGB42_00070 [Andreprevotia sp. IGB-42]|uniref:DUF72 domain-containing protein n=1 Tax=Andreprevotia sp. IGB-42 TaxID=2497473 RepID=UPI00135B037D|nr:DUF72 domain-containing protein [Andreprevotia sp. IGB-42]KAF0814993.1 hypothetical protein IGB42_00070 [Andreprevotia sp. IGB-42]